MTTVGPTVPTAVTGLHTSAPTAAAPKQTLDKEVFLSLLVAQLRNQDPSSPMDTNEMMAQSSQLASMEQLTSLAETSRESFSLQMRVAASGLVGQEVSYVDDEGVTHTGVADAVSFADAVPMVSVGTATVALDAVATIRARTTAPTPAGAVTPVPPTTAPPAAAPTTSTTTPPPAQAATEGN